MRKETAVSSSASDGNKDKGLNRKKLARLAGAIWIHGSIDVEYSRDRPYYLPRIVLTMKNLLPYAYCEDVGGRVYHGRNGTYTLMIKRWRLVKQLLEGIREFIGGEEEKQIDIALEIIRINHSGRLSKAKNMPQLEKLHAQWKECRARIEKWAEDLRTQHGHEKEVDVPVEIWSRAYPFEACAKSGAGTAKAEGETS